MSLRFVRARASVAPILREPRAAATQESQLLFGHPAEVLTTDGSWLRIRGGDGYEGWIHHGFTETAEARDRDAWAWDDDVEISLGCTLRDEHGGTLDLPLGAIVASHQCASGRSLDRARRRETFPPEGSAIAASATGLFQGTYYQWGGITPWGADCSGMVQTVFALHGVRLLRDAWQQATQGVHVEGGIESVEAADLLFFSDRADGHITHVAIATGAHGMVHLALGRGGHAVESFDPGDEYLNSVRASFRFARRIV